MSKTISKIFCETSLFKSPAGFELSPAKIKFAKMTISNMFQVPSLFKSPNYTEE